MQPKFTISLTGPESSGKTTLAQTLADYFQLPLVPEYARNFLLEGGKVRNSQDLILLACQQIQSEAKLLQTTPVGIICDTDMIVLKVWCMEKFERVPMELNALCKHHRYDLTLLCSPDLKWQPDPLRENPMDRDRLFNIYLEEIQKLKINFKVVAGQGSHRTLQAIKIVREYLKLA